MAPESLKDVQVPENTPAKSQEDDSTEKPALNNEVAELKKLPSESSLESALSLTSSTIPVFDDSIQEAWLLRQEPAVKTLQSSHYFLGLKISSSYTHKPASHYVKPLQTSAAEIEVLVSNAAGNVAGFTQGAEMRALILGFEDDAQWEIQRLTEARGNACSNGTVKREWEVVAVQTRPRRKVCEGGRKGWGWWGRDIPVEWVMVLRGETVAWEERVMPGKHVDPWKKCEVRGGRLLEM